eukprot:TRINITY_DN63890_c0_g1_i1.p1 TRINITY_DN63890_c0_g1~~TRINITY_DN63890_c0_g1_i1.p1  ORF type:complete len:223 (-),score=60.39 TRINITY_DN63890_c0_g1_i1:44-679(-)
MAAGPGSKITQHDYLVKLLLIGDSGVGKSSLLAKFVDDKFVLGCSQTIGMDFKAKVLELGGKRVKLQIWDTAGQERFHTITQQYYRNAHGVILVYDATCEESFTNIRRWASQIATHGGEGTDRAILGNKVDADGIVVETERGQALADEYGIPFFETSAKSGLNVEQAFASIADTVRQRLQGKEDTSGLGQGGLKLGYKEVATQRRGCCAES